MSKFCINRPIVAIVISILTVIAGVVALLGLPTAQFPEISDRRFKSLPTIPAPMQSRSPSLWPPPLSSKWRVWDGMNYMSSAERQQWTDALTVDFGIDTVTNTGPDPCPDAGLTGQCANFRVRCLIMAYGAEVQASAPLMLIDLSSTSNAFNNIFWRNYALSI